MASRLLRQFLRTARPTRPQHSQTLRFKSIRVSAGDRSTFSERGYVLLSIPLATFGLGCWQVHRRKWKLGLIQQLEEKTLADPVPFPVDWVNELPALEYRKVTVTGEFDHSREVLMGPRSLLKNENENRGGLITQSGNTGYHVITPFRIHDRNLTILVNRGWVPMEKKNPKTRTEGQINGLVTLTGVVRKTENRPQFGPKNEPKKGVWHYKDLESMSYYLDTEPVMIDATRAGTVEGGPAGGQTRVSLRNEHLSYIFTWYSLCAATLWMWYTRYGRKFLFKK